MSNAELTSSLLSFPSADNREPVALARKRLKPGERREQILQALAQMLEQPGSERITTAALAARLEVSEAALYRHFASKAQMFEGLIEFIEQTVFSLVNQIAERQSLSATEGMVAAGASPVLDAVTSAQTGVRQAAQVVTMLLQFAEKNPGMTRVMVGDALVFENERLQQGGRRVAWFGHTQSGHPGAGVGPDCFCRWAPAALCALQLQAPAVREPRSQPGTHALNNFRQS